MQCKANKGEEITRKFFIVMCFVLIIFSTVIYMVVIVNDEETTAEKFLIMGLYWVLLISMVFAIILVHLSLFIISASPKGITVTRGAKILFNHKWTEIKDFGCTHDNRGNNIIYFSTYNLTQKQKDKFIFGLNWYIQKGVFGAYADSEIVNYAIVNSKVEPENTKCTFMSNIDRKSYNRKLALIISIIFAIPAISYAFLFALTTKVLVININVITFAVLHTIICVIALYLFSLLYSHLSKLYANRLEYDGESVKVVSNGYPSENMRELKMIRVRQIGIVTDGKNRYIYFTEDPIQNANIKTVRNLYKKSSLIYCEYNEDLFEQIKAQYLGKVKL